MKNQLKALAIGVLVLALIIVGTGLMFRAGRAQTATQQPAADQGTVRSVQVTGTGQVRAEPDIVRVRIGVQTQAQSAVEALTENNDQMQAVLDALESAGIPANNIQTQTVNLQPQYNNQPQQTGPQEITGYIASNIVSVESDQIDQIGEILDTAVQAGGNTIEGIQFDVSNPEDLLDQAREEAMQDAQRKARQYVTAVGAELGPVLTINETGGVVPFASRELAQPAGGAVPVQPGTQTMEVTVSVTWEIQ
jgi:uncharacterized protein YggE